MAIITFLLGLAFFPFVYNASPFQLLIVALVILVVGHSARRRIKGSGGTLRGGGIASAGLVLGYLFAVIVFIGPSILPTLGPDRRSGPIDASRIRQIGQASLIYANDHQERLPPATLPDGDGERPVTIHDVVLLLALHGGLNDASLWFSPRDEALSGKEKHFEAVANREKKVLTSDLENQQVFSYDYVTGLTASFPSATPIAWTRGLREDGTWDREGVYGTDGGHIVFLGGNSRFFKNLTGENQLLRPDGAKTSNILETLPPGTRVVGGGPASLAGSVTP